VHAIHGWLGFGGAVGGSGRRKTGGVTVDLAIDLAVDVRVAMGVCLERQRVWR
jgi:hypothetical protein